MRYHGSIFIRWLIVSVAFITTGIAVRSAPTDSVKVVASVVDITKRETPLSPGIGVGFVIHSPERLRAMKFILVVKSGNRAQVRATYPIASVESIELPASTVDALVKQRKTWESTEHQIDTGVRPEMISEAILLPSIDSEQLRVAPAPVETPE